MDVIFEPTTATGGGKSFSIEVGFFDTVLEMKEKIHKYEGIPVPKQTLIFNGQVLQDQRDVASYDIFMFSRVRLLIAPSDHAAAAASSSSSTPEQHLQQPSEEAKGLEVVGSSAEGLSTTTSWMPSADLHPTKIQLLLRMPPTTWSSTRLLSAVEMDANDVVRRLKEKIRDQMMMGVAVPLHLLALHPVSTTATRHAKPAPELQDHKTLRECDLSHHSEIKVSIKPTTPPPSHAATTPSPPPSTLAANNSTTHSNSNSSSNNSNNNNKKVAATNNNNNNSNNNKGGGGGGGAAAGVMMTMKVMVQPKCGTRKIPVEVNAEDNVGVLKKELGRLQEQQHFHLPSDGYFFIYKQNVMDDDRSFRWHHVSQGDTIEIFNGSVTGGC